MRHTFTTLLLVPFALSAILLTSGCVEQDSADKKTPTPKNLSPAAKVEPARPADAGPRARFVECLTSGTTGLPIKVIVTREGVLASNGLVPVKANDPGN